MKEHHWHIHLTWPDQSAMAEHSFGVEHRLQLQDAQIFTSTLLHGPEHQGGDTLYCDKEDGLVLKKSCKPLIHIFPEVKSFLGLLRTLVILHRQGFFFLFLSLTLLIPVPMSFSPTCDLASVVHPRFLYL
jgi:hypothetical protein